MAITINRAYSIVSSNATLTHSARMQIQEKLLFYEEKEEILQKELNLIRNSKIKIERILQLDNNLKLGKVIM